jgi:hypothetical protein
VAEFTNPGPEPEITTTLIRQVLTEAVRTRLEFRQTWTSTYLKYLESDPKGGHYRAVHQANHTCADSHAAREWAALEERMLLLRMRVETPPIDDEPES